MGWHSNPDMTWLAKVSPLTYTVSVGAFSARRVGLALLVGLNLSLICQGHLVGGHQVHPHVTLLDAFDPHVEFAASEQVVAAGTGSREPAATQGANMLALAYGPGAPAEASGLNFLTVAALLLLLRAASLQYSGVATWRTLRSQLSSQPESPPPRYAANWLIG